MDNEKQQPNVGAVNEFCTEFMQCWNQLPNKVLFFGLLGAWLLLFQFLGNCSFGYVDTSSIMYWMYNAYIHSDGTEDHGLYIPFLVLILFWLKRKELLELPNRVWSPALLLLVGALALHVLGYVVQQQRISIVAFFGGIYALMGLAWGPAWMRRSFFPFFLFGFCLPITSMSIIDSLTFSMRIGVCKIVVVLAHIIGMDVVRQGTMLFNAQQHYQYEVAAACSGLRSVVAILCISTVYGFLTFEKGWKRVLLMAAALPLSMLGNVTRMMIIILAAETSGQSAGNYVHENAFFSMVPYVPAIAGVMVLGHWLRERDEPSLPLTPKPI